MPTFKTFKTTMVVLATINLIFPLHLVSAQAPALSQSTTASEVPASYAKASDVILGEGGRLSGQILDANGKAKGGLSVEIEQFGQKVGQTKSDAEGRFAVENVRGGICHIRVGDSVSVCRCWTAQAAPPAAKPQVLVISDPQLERGQRPIGEILTNPLLIGAVLVAAVAIPIAVHNSSTKKSGS